MKTKTLKDKLGNPIQIEQGQVRGLKEALANVSGGGVSGKEVVEIITPLFNADSLDNADYQTANFNGIDLNNKYIIWDWYKTEYQNFDNLQLESFQWLTMEFLYKQPKNATILIKMPYFEKIKSDTYFSIVLDKNYVYLDCRVRTSESMTYEVCRYYEDEQNSLTFSYDNFVSGCQFIKIDFDEYGFAIVYFYDFYEM